MPHETHLARAHVLLRVIAKPLARVTGLTDSVNTFWRTEHNHLNRIRSALAAVQIYSHNVEFYGRDHLTEPNLALMGGALGSIQVLADRVARTDGWRDAFEDITSKDLPPARVALDAFEKLDTAWRAEPAKTRYGGDRYRF